MSATVASRARRAAHHTGFAARTPRPACATTPHVVRQPATAFEGRSFVGFRCGEHPDCAHGERRPSPPADSATKFRERPRAPDLPAHAAAVTTATATAAATEFDSSAEIVDPPTRAHPPRLRLLRYEPDPGGPPPPPSPTAPARRPHVVSVDPVDGADPRRCIDRVLRLALEVLDGRRPLAQLAPHLAPSAVRYMRAAVAQRPPWREPARNRPCPCGSGRKYKHCHGLPTAARP